MTPRGWCPSLHEPMQTGDGLLARVKPRGGQLTAEAARTIARAAARRGNGMIDLTQRGNVQVRGLSEASAVAFATEMVAAGLAAADAGAERRRTVAVAPMTDARVVADLETRLEAATTLQALSAKFGFVVEARDWTLRDVGGDVRMAPADDGWRVWPDGATMAVTTAQPVDAALALAEASLALAPEARRMRAAVAARGEAAMFAAAGLRASAPVPHAGTARPTIGRLPGGCGVALPYGAIEAGALADVADIAARQTLDGVLRIAAPRALFLRCDEARRCDVLAALGLLSLIVDPGDPRLHIAACPGAPACASAHAATRLDAAILARALGDVASPHYALHVSGCTKGCAHPAPALTLVAQAEGYAVIRNGRASDEPERRAMTLHEAIEVLRA